MRINKKTRTFFAFLITVVIFYFIWRSLRLSWQEILSLTFKLDYGKLFLGILVYALFSIFMSYCWVIGLRNLGIKFNTRKLMGIWLLCQPGKYVPGKVGIVAGRIYLCQRQGLSGSRVFVSAFLEDALSCVAGIMLFTISLGYNLNLLPSKYLFFLFAIFILFLFFIHPKVFNFLANLFLRRFSKEYIRVNVKYKQILNLFFMYLAAWLIAGVSFYLITSGVTSVHLEQLPSLIGIFSLSWVIGFLSFLTPGGLGVREGIMISLLRFHFSSPLSFLISVVNRISLTLCEVIVASLIIFKKAHERIRLL